MEKKEWGIPPEANAECVCAMEERLEGYKRPDNARYPIVCMDESSPQHIKEVRQPLPAEPGKQARYDREYERHGVSDLLMFFEPLAGNREVVITERRTAIDWA